MTTILGMRRDLIRRANLLRLVREFHTIATVAKRANTSPNYLTQILNQHQQPNGKPRTVGNQLADALETGCGKYPGWMDIDHENPPFRETTQISDDERIIIMLYRSIDDQLRGAVLSAVKLIASTRSNR